jgi:hypothetical protein
MKKIDLELNIEEKMLLKQKGITQKSLADYAIDEVIAVLAAQPRRARILQALFEFQTIPSVGITFAKDLLFMDFYNLYELRDRQGPELLDLYESTLGCRVDPCVEDQFWLVIHYANNPYSKKQWWDFTPARKAYRAQYGYPINRP